MTPAALAIIGSTIVVSSFISGVFGMAGGMVLLGVLLVYFDVATGMVLFSIIQLTANGWRALHWRQFVRWPIFYWYVAGALLAFAVMRYVAYVPPKAMVYILLGLMPFSVELLPESARPNIEWRGVPFVTGIFTTVIQFMAGVGGLFLDIFFNKSKLDRKTTNGCSSTSSSTRASSTARPPTPPRPLPRPSATCCAPPISARSRASAISSSWSGGRAWCWRWSAPLPRPSWSSA
jgi:uncharacterized membrane protein YfcA